MIRLSQLCTVPLILLASSPSSILAQAGMSGDRGNNPLVVTMRVGAHVSDNQLVFPQRQDPLTGELQGPQTQLDESGSIGLQLSLASGVEGLFFAIEGDRTVGADLVTKERRGVRSCGEHCSEIVSEEVDVGVDVALWTLGLNLQYYPLERFRTLQPFLIAGTGLKYYAVDDLKIHEMGLNGYATDIDGSVQLGAGCDFRIGKRELRAQFIDYFTPNKSYHDLSATIGLIWRLR